MLLWIIIIFVYFLSVIGAYLEIRNKYLNDWTNISPNVLDAAIVFLPAFNTILTMMLLFELFHTNKL